MSIQNSSLLYLFLASKKPPCTCFSIVLGVQWGTASWRMQHTSAFNERFLSDRRRKDALTETYSIAVQAQPLSYSFTPLLPTHEARWGLFCSAFIFRGKGSARCFPWCFNYDSAASKISGPVLCAFNSCVPLSMQREKLFEGTVRQVWLLTCSALFFLFV